MADRRIRYTFLKDDRIPSYKISFVLSGLSAAVLVACVIAAFILNGKGGTLLGAAGLVSMVLAAAAFIAGIVSLSGHRDSQRAASFSTISAGVLVIIWAGILMLGFH